MNVPAGDPLPLLGIASNLSFIFYALMAGMLPVLILHGLLLPLDVYRLAQIERARRQPKHARSRLDIDAPYGAMPLLRSALQE
jgi:hypothetical protein